MREPADRVNQPKLEGLWSKEPHMMKWGFLYEPTEVLGARARWIKPKWRTLWTATKCCLRTRRRAHVQTDNWVM